MIFLIPLLALLAGVTQAQTNTSSLTNTTLVPITTANSTVQDAAPSTNITLNWASLNSSQMVAVALAMNYSTIVLEDLAAVSNVECSESSVEVTFNETAEFNEAQTQWTELADEIVLITNHMGNCDVDFERGFFLADIDSMVFSPSNMTVVMSAEKTNVTLTALETEINFQNIPASTSAGDASLSERTISLDQSGLTVAYDYEITSSTQIYANANKTFTIDITHAQINSSATYSGHIKYSLLEAKLTEMYFDVSKTLNTDLTLDFALSEPYTYTLAYSPAQMTYYIAEVPGIISLGPALKFSIGAEFTAKAGVDVTTDVSAQISGATAHVDLINPSESSSSGWVPTFSATANVTEKAEVELTPSMDVTAELEISLFGGLLDLSTGVKAEPKFPVDFTVEATESATGTVGSTNGTATASGSAGLPTGSCENGADADIKFAFTLTAFASQWESVTLYEYSKDILSQCYTWF